MARPTISVIIPRHPRALEARPAIRAIKEILESKDLPELLTILVVDRVFCAKPGCVCDAQIRGFCRSHFMVARRKGLMPTPSTESRYEAKVDRSGGPDACHPWTASRNPRGYGTFGHDGESLAARWAYKHYVGPLADGQDVLHHCDNPPCQNRSHWFIGDDVANTLDKMIKGRQYRPEGTLNPKAKLTPAEVVEIRSKHEQGVSRWVLAAEYGVTPTSVSAIVRRQTWRNLP